MYKVALAGYTNAGKSTLLNAITGSEVLAYDKLFATLDSTTRRLSLKDGREITLSDTVGFIQKLPTTLIEAFKSTLEEVVEADLILHVVDAADIQAQAQIQTVVDVLEQIGAHDLPSLLVFNKCDLLDAEQLASLISHHPQALTVSAQSKQGIDELLTRIEQTANASSVLLDLLIPFERGALVKLAHEQGTIIEETYSADGTHLQVRLPKVIASKFNDYV
jgi:GTP-binding protein HflX